jgi:aminobenzoyl-glutamate utilization protein A
MGGGSDDAHLMIREVQKAGGIGAYILVGASNPAPHHHSLFDIDEDAMGIAVNLLESLLRAEAHTTIPQTGAAVRGGDQLTAY